MKSGIAVSPFIIRLSNILDSLKINRSSVVDCFSSNMKITLIGMSIFEL